MKRQIILKEDLKVMVTNWRDEDIFSECITSAIETATRIGENKENGVNENITNYVRVDMMFGVTSGDDDIDRLLVCVKSWIQAYSNTNRMIVKNICDKVGVEQDELIEIIETYGKEFGLTYDKRKDKYRRTFKYICAN